MADSIVMIDELDDYLKATAGTCVAKFTAKWCGPCRKLAPLYAELAATHSDKVPFLEIDVDHSEPISAHEKVKSIPLFLFYFEGQKIHELTVTGSNPGQLQAKMASFLDLIPSIKATSESPKVDEPEHQVRIIEPQVTMVQNQFAQLALDGLVDDSSDESEEESESGILSDEEPPAQSDTHEYGIECDYSGEFQFETEDQSMVFAAQRASKAEIS